MIVETTYTNREITAEINQALGIAFGLIDRFKMGGIGSERLSIGSVSPEYQHYLKPEHYNTYANIEIRPKGILLHFRHKLEAYAWIMPFATLTVKIEENTVSIQSGDKFISFKNVNTADKFWSKLEKAQSGLR